MLWKELNYSKNNILKHYTSPCTLGGLSTVYLQNVQKHMGAHTDVKTKARLYAFAAFWCTIYTEEICGHYSLQLINWRAPLLQRCIRTFIKLFIECAVNILEQNTKVLKCQTLVVYELNADSHIWLFLNFITISNIFTRVIFLHIVLL